MREEIARHECEDDDGSRYTVIEYQNYTRSRPISGPAQNIPTTKELFLSDGRAVTWIDDDTFEIVATDEIIRKIG